MSRASNNLEMEGNTSLRKVAILLAVLLSFGQLQSQSPTAASSSARKITERVAPAYPELAKRMGIRGTVRVEVIVKPNGTVKSTRLLGGSPVLVDAAVDAVKKWKFQTAQGESTEVVQVAFENQ
jgi:TonB family protein